MLLALWIAMFHWQLLSLSHRNLEFYLLSPQTPFDRCKKTDPECRHLAPRAYHPFVHLAWNYDEEGDYHKAAEFMKKALETLPDDDYLGGELEEYYVNLGEYENARESMVKALEIRSIIALQWMKVRIIKSQ
jgi:tetratricopeptide (TPR) repeat protein